MVATERPSNILISDMVHVTLCRNTTNNKVAVASTKKGQRDSRRLKTGMDLVSRAIRGHLPWRGVYDCTDQC